MPSRQAGFDMAAARKTTMLALDQMANIKVQAVVSYGVGHCGKATARIRTREFENNITIGIVMPVARPTYSYSEGGYEVRRYYCGLVDAWLTCSNSAQLSKTR